MGKYKCEICGFIYDEDEKDVPFNKLIECPMCEQPISNFIEVGNEKEKLNKVYKCKICGHIFDEAKEGKPLSSLDKCPTCKKDINNFEEIKEEKELKDKYECKKCGYIYDEIAENAPFSQLNCCPLCKALPNEFKKEGKENGEILKDKYKCSVCGYIFNEEKEGKPFSSLKKCPVCKKPASVFNKITKEKDEKDVTNTGTTMNLEYQSEYVRHDKSDRYMEEIHEIAVSGKSIIEAMSTKMKMPNWDDILIMGAGLNPPPLDEHANVNTQTIIGKNAKKPMVIESPIYISHMSFGALSKETKISLSKASAMAKTAMCSGEGGILPEEMNSAYKYIFEYVPNLYSVTKENLEKADAIEIKIGQGTKPGMGGHLPGEKVTPEISKIRNKPLGEDVISPSKFKDINTKEDLKALVDKLRKESDGRPIGIKIAAGRIEDDLEYCVFAGADFVTIDGRGGATGASPKLLRDSSSVPTIYALYRARKYLNSVNSDISLVITGGLRVSSDFIKALAMGADAVAIASSALIAAACQQYRICGTGMCPVGIATQDINLRKRLKEDAAVQRVYNFLNVSNEELKTFARISGHDDVHKLSNKDIYTINREISDFTNINHV